MAARSPVRCERYGFSADTIDKLKAMGHNVAEVGGQGVAEVIVLNPKDNMLEGGVDKRRPTARLPASRVVPSATLSAIPISRGGECHGQIGGQPRVVQQQRAVDLDALAAGEHPHAV